MNGKTRTGDLHRVGRLGVENVFDERLAWLELAAEGVQRDGLVVKEAYFLAVLLIFGGVGVVIGAVELCQHAPCAVGIH